jgi:replicative superfamily II helicase
MPNWQIDVIFAHTKKTGQMMASQLKSMKIDCEFHNADLDKEKRGALETKFKTDPNFKVVVATSTLAAGLNMPAKRVIILGVHRGLTEVSSLEIIQECGRAGRPRYDKFGIAFVLLPASKYDYFKNKLQKPQKIVSQLLENKILAFHLVSEIHHGNIKTREDIHSWYSRSLAHWQEKNLDDEILESTVDLLKKCGAIVEEDGEFKVTAIGKISSMFYYSPFDVSSLRNNFSKLFENHQENNDHYVSMALGNTDTYRVGIVSNAEKEAMFTYSRMFPNVKDPPAKAGSCWMCS